MVDANEPWRVEGVSDDARAAAETAARHAGQDLGSWLDDAIREAVSGEPTTMSNADIAAAIADLQARIAASEATAWQSIAPLRDRLAQLSQTLEQIEATMRDDRECAD
jgi:hypothetical protein